MPPRLQSNPANVHRVQPASGRSLRLASVAGAIVVLLAIVSYASRSGFGHSESSATNTTYVNYAFTVFLILFALTVPLALWAMLITAGDKRSTPNPVSRRRRILSLVLLALLAALVVYLLTHLHHVHQHGSWPLAPVRAHSAHPASPLPKAPDRSVHFEWPVVWIALALAFLAVAVFVVLRRRGAEEIEAEEPNVADDVAASIGDAIDDLEREGDPRRAVIAAYARMEGVLGRHGLRRRPSDTPIEYLRRVLLELTTSGGAVERLTSLFERAKFSDHEVTLAMKGDAIAALRGIRDGLAT
jgi:hypothetical protein